MAYIGIDRGIENHWIYQDAEYFKVWFEILLRTRYSREPEKKLMEGKFITIEYGQFMFGRTSWSDRLKVSEQRMRTLFKKLIDDDMIELIQKFPKFSLYSVKNYAKYHQQSNQQKDETGKEISGIANQQINNTPTSSQPAANQQLTTQEESKPSKPRSNKNKEIIYTVEFLTFWDLYPRTVQQRDAFKVWQKVIKDGGQSEEIIECAANYSAYCQANGTEEKFIKHPTTFLREDRYKEYKSPVLIKGGGNRDQSRQGVQSGRNAAKGRADSDDEYDDITLGSYTAKVQ